MNMEKAASIKDQCLARAWAAVKSAKPDDRQGLPSKTWAEMSLRTKSVLVMLGAASLDDPREVARRPWGSISEQDREGIATCARELAKSLNNASCLF